MKYNENEWLEFMMHDYEGMITRNVFEAIRSAFSKKVFAAINSDPDLADMNLTLIDNENYLSFLIYGSWAGLGINLTNGATTLNMNLRRLDEMVSAPRASGQKDAIVKIKSYCQALSELIDESEYQCELHQDDFDKLKACIDEKVEEFYATLNGIDK